MGKVLQYSLMSHIWLPVDLKEHRYSRNLLLLLLSQLHVT